MAWSAQITVFQLLNLSWLIFLIWWMGRFQVIPVIDVCVGIVAGISIGLLVMVTLFCVSVLSGDAAYIFLRLCLRVPEQQVWTKACRWRWMAVWLFTWFLQAPLWLRALSTRSPLIIHEAANLVLTVYHSICVAFMRLPVPSASLVSSSETHSTSFRMIGMRCSIPLFYILLHGVPIEWKEAFTCFLLDLSPYILSSLSWMVGVQLPWERSARPPWILRYPEVHMLESEDDCDVHGVCPICLSNLCSPDGGMAAGCIVQHRRRVAPSLSAARRRSRCTSLLNASGISATRSPLPWFGNRIAITRCGHSFHATCLTTAVGMHPRCPQCRMSISTSDFGTELADEETLDCQILSLLFGYFLGAVLLITHWLLWTAHSPKPEVEDALRNATVNGTEPSHLPKYGAPVWWLLSFWPVLIVRWLQMLYLAMWPVVDEDYQDDGAAQLY